MIPNAWYVILDSKELQARRLVDVPEWLKLVPWHDAPFVKEMIHRKNNVQIIDQKSQMIELVEA